MKLIKGRKIADKILSDLKKKIAKEKIKPGLAVILIGESEASKMYVNLKKKAARKIGVYFSMFKFGKNIPQNTIISKIRELNKDDKVHGILVQLPLPGNFNTQKIIKAINPKKDADGFSAREHLNIIKPVFPSAIIRLIKSSGQKLNNKKAVVLCNSDDFGKAMQSALKKEKISSIYIFSADTKKNLEKIKKADILITACGIPRLIRGDMIKKGAVIIDGGIAKKGKKVFGDVDFESVKNIASYITPVPGGVGPVTIACLLKNVWKLSQY